MLREAGLSWLKVNNVQAFTEGKSERLSHGWFERILGMKACDCDMYAAIVAWECMGIVN